MTSQVNQSPLFLLTMVRRDVKFGIQIESDWPQMGQIWDFLRSGSVHFGALRQNVLKLILKSHRFAPFGANLTQFGYQNLKSLVTGSRFLFFHTHLNPDYEFSRLWNTFEASPSMMIMSYVQHCFQHCFDEPSTRYVITALTTDSQCHLTTQVDQIWTILGLCQTRYQYIWTCLDVNGPPIFL